MLNHVELHGLSKGSALANGNNITLRHVGEGGRAVDRDVVVSLGKTSVLGDILQIISTNNNGSLHLGGDDQTLQDAATDGHIAGEGALLVNIGAIDGLLGGLETQTNVLVVSGSLR